MGEQAELPLAKRQLKALTVTQLVRAVRETLELTLDEFWVVGEISNARSAASNHFYFTLKDQRSSINAVMFRSAYNRLRFKVADGMEVIVRGRINLYETRGALQLYVEEMEPRGLGALQLAFEQLKQRLEAQGLFAAAHKRALPFLPRTIGIVTALGGAALRDIVTVLLSRYPNLHLIVRPARVQGPGAAAEIVEAIADLNRHGRAELIIVGRGGGSLEDLWAFNEEAVARAIHDSAIPIVSAVGHEIDYTIADFAADLRAPTPSAAASLVVPNKYELRRRLEETEAALAGKMPAIAAANRKHVAQLALRLKDPLAIIRELRQRLDEAGAALAAGAAAANAASRRRMHELAARLRGPALLMRESRLSTNRLALHLAQRMGARAGRLRGEVERLSTHLSISGRRAFELRRARLVELAARLDAISPLKVLERGYAVVTNLRDGSAVGNAGAVEIGDELSIRLKRGRLRARTIARQT